MLKHSPQSDFEELLNNGSYNQSRIAEFTKYLGLDAQTFNTECSYSYWQHIEGYNRTIVADTAIKGRYYIFTVRKPDDGSQDFEDCVIVENGKIIERKTVGEVEVPEVISNSNQELIDMYEKVRHLERFSADHCPVMEFQTSLDGEHYFLQTHRGQDEKLTTFTLEGELKTGEIEATFIRGATVEVGKEVDVYLWNYALATPKVIEEEEAGFDPGYTTTFSEIMTRRRSIQLLNRSKEKILDDATSNHNPRSLLFKPGITVGIDYDDYNKLVNQLSPDYLRRCVKNNQPPVIKLRIVADGRRAIVRKAP